MILVENNPPRSIRIPLAAISFGLGIAVATYTTGKNAFFLYNFAYSWLPQVAVLCVALLCRASRESLVGMATAMGLYLFLFDLWATDSMAWLFYLFSFPGILIGALFGAFLIPSRKVFKAPVAFACLAIGIVGNLAVLAITVS